MVQPVNISPAFASNHRILRATSGHLRPYRRLSLGVPLRLVQYVKPNYSLYRTYYLK